ncbi:hypothetical protein LEP1GSC103_0065 [Leptospira borgpetersenii serovar Javanica str. UI 09931]|uniref:Uncharacterized protein n=4 Tax=Leptospira borgpetersenii TaxID=174 RepID=M3GZI6_LEPBO|nr:hypothetical protein [Leptospira borgpetersenii]EKP14747.1 hypothetical protein LEP1GSC128_1891 [Leptospira borgpetersenii str. 200801926]EKQ92647.1 hypothetical protein LEP1GSC101_2463 [Leptospira borgpetersenii str. UI 09149]EMG00259.1 hypothetical protein LEP1GSC123_2272 [Leptospira borgpetersenii str. 200701203]EMN57154.1 hypothetical protein LEP1GSC090_4083 [Leptospira borgpetersenii serovar Javanica str. MK146]EPG58584.1 hypothetical protein LEP1GSC103_0065 [Leptospira borgpetersenii 
MLRVQRAINPSSDLSGARAFVSSSDSSIQEYHTYKLPYVQEPC